MWLLSAPSPGTGYDACVLDPILVSYALHGCTGVKGIRILLGFNPNSTGCSVWGVIHRGRANGNPKAGFLAVFNFMVSGRVPVNILWGFLFAWLEEAAVKGVCRLSAAYSSRAPASIIMARLPHSSKPGYFRVHPMRR